MGKKKKPHCHANGWKWICCAKCCLRPHFSCVVAGSVQPSLAAVFSPTMSRIWKVSCTSKKNMKGACTSWLTSHRAKQRPRATQGEIVYWWKCEREKLSYQLIPSWSKPNLFPVERHCGYWGVMGSPWTSWATCTPWSLQATNLTRGRSWLWSSPAGTVQGIQFCDPGTGKPLDSGNHISTYSSRRQQAFKLSTSQEFVYHQGSSDFSLLLSIAFFSVFAEIALHFIFFSRVFGLQQGWGAAKLNLPVPPELGVG